MKWMSLIVAAGLIFGVVGCKDDKKDNKNKGKVEGEGGKALEVSVSPKEVTLTPGDKDGKKVTVTIERTKFDEAVKVTISDLPDGAEVDEKTKEIPKGNKEVKFTLTADADAK